MASSTPLGEQHLLWLEVQLSGNVRVSAGFALGVAGKISAGDTGERFEQRGEQAKVFSLKSRRSPLRSPRGG